MWAMQSSLSFGLVETEPSPRGSHLQCTGGNATPPENEERNIGLVQWGRWSAIRRHCSQPSGGVNPPTPLPAAGRSFHSRHLYSICVNVVGCLVLPSTCFVTVFFHVLIRLLQNPIRRLPKMSHVCRHGCLQDVSAQRCGAVWKAWETTTLAQHNSLFIWQNALVEHREGLAGLHWLSISFQVKCNGFIVTPKDLHASLAATGTAPCEIHPPLHLQRVDAMLWNDNCPDGLRALERDPLRTSGSPTFPRLWHVLICLVLDPQSVRLFLDIESYTGRRSCITHT